ncbi:glycosyltransferase [Pseudoalteromonas sp. S1612]|uniref:glycosyltransferase n=1 Tax=Pseudoalteromonas sp. S1612 TaxID=579507 RepID=UPI00110A6AA5|nr:glycosyltransferase [Pseudoalteromonas sp. S1612]TMP54723.1 hypothetical protein CWB78_10590 [Pseudoalteromonas sp. S1612]
MLIIYNTLRLGGIETFYMRLAKTRYLMGKKTKILLTSKAEASNEQLLYETKKYADVYFLNDFFKPGFFNKLTLHFLLLKSIDFSELSKVFDDVDQVHVSSAIYGFLYLNIRNKLKINIPLTVGIYHSKEFTWGEGDKIPYYERCNRVLFTALLKSKGVYFFNDGLINLYSQFFDFDKNNVNIFPLGVIDSGATESNNSKLGDPIRIVSVGRLVNFKAYNLWMVDVVEKLQNDFNIEYHIFGDGPLAQEIKRKIEKHKLNDKIFLKGNIPYSDFKSTVSQYDIFVGSGTAIVEASSLGIPSVVGIESLDEPLSYGFLCDIVGFSYNEDGLYEKHDVASLISNYLYLNENERHKYKSKHMLWSQKFSMQKCVGNFEQGAITAKPLNISLGGLIFKLRYSLSYFFFSLYCRVKGKSLSNFVYG